MRKLSVVFVPALAGVVLGQNVDLSIHQPGEPVRVEIKSSVKSKTERRTLMNGEERSFGGRGGAARGPQESSSEQKVVFDLGDGWRKYHELTAKVERMGRDGEPVESEIKGSLAGKKVYLEADEEGQLVLVEGEGDDAQELPRNLSRGIESIDFTGLMPDEAVAVGDEFEIDGKGLRAALKGLMHPVSEARERGGRGQDGGGRGQRGGRGGFMGRMGRGAPNPADDVLSAEKLDWKVKGRLTAVENGVAVVEVSGRASGKGEPEDLGMQTLAERFGGGRGGRGGGRGGFGGNAERKVDIAFEIDGEIHVNVETHQLVGMNIAGKLRNASETKMEMERRGDTMDIETTSNEEATIKVEVACSKAK